MSADEDLAIIIRQFRELTGRELVPRATNRLEDRFLRVDNVFAQLADEVFLRPELAEKLDKMARQWLSRCSCETTRALAGYAAYIVDDYARAANHFLSAISANPSNVDNWTDLAFALMHMPHPLGRQILYHFEEYMRRFIDLGEPLCTLGRLRDIAEATERDGKDYRIGFREWIPTELLS